MKTYRIAFGIHPAGLLSGFCVVFPHVHAACFYPKGSVRIAIHYSFRLNTLAEPLDPVVLPILSTEDGGCGVRSPLHQFKEKVQLTVRYV